MSEKLRAVILWGGAVGLASALAGPGCHGARPKGPTYLEHTHFYRLPYNMTKAEFLDAWQEAHSHMRGGEPVEKRIVNTGRDVWEVLIYDVYGRSRKRGRGSGPSAREIDPELQELAVGDVVPNVPNGATGFTVERVVPGHVLVFGPTVTLPERIPVDAIGVRGPTSWAFVLDERVPMSTRLIVRIRAAGPTPLLEAPVRRFWGLAHVVMQRKQLRELAARAESRP